MTGPDVEYRTDAPSAPDARVLSLDLGSYGHRGSLTTMFWYRSGGHLHAHQSMLLPAEASVRDQMDMLEGTAESYPEYWRVAPVVAIGVTVLSSEGRNEVRRHLDSWYNPPHRRRLLAVGAYAGEQAGGGVVSRKKLRDLLAHRMSVKTLAMTTEQQKAAALYTGQRGKPRHDPDLDGWRHDDTDALVLPVMYACLAAKYLLPAPTPTPKQQAAAKDRLVRAWQIEMGLDEAQAREQAARYGHPSAFRAAEAGPTSMPMPGTSVLNLPLKGALS